MKPTHLLLLILLLICSCKITEKHVIGSYKSTNSHFNVLQLRSDHTFRYTDFDVVYWVKKELDIDSCYFTSEGKWSLLNKKLVLDSYSTEYSDTARLRKIVETHSIAKESNFSFKDVDGNTIYFYRVDDEAGYISWIVDSSYESFKVDLAKHRLLKFYFSLSMYKPYTFLIPDNSSINNYDITLAPYFKAAYFANKSFEVKRNRVLGVTYMNTLVTFKKSKTSVK